MFDFLDFYLRFFCRFTLIFASFDTRTSDLFTKFCHKILLFY